MFTIEESFSYIPVQYNIAWFNKKSNRDCVVIRPEDVKDLVDYCKQHSGKTFIWDMEKLNYINDRSFTGAFQELVQHHCNVIIANVEKGSVIEKEVRNGLDGVEGIQLPMEGKKTSSYRIGTEPREPFKSDTIDLINKHYVSSVIEEECVEIKHSYLVSSGVYSNMQINLKHLFEDKVNFKYIIYLLWKQIYELEVDGIIATSKNGVAFASVLGDILGQSVLYFNIGQMFEEIYNCSPEIKRDGQYIHIYDMICLGSEAKVLNALVTAQGGKVIKAVGCICLPDLEIVKKRNRYSALNQVWSIVGQNDLKKKYDISLYERGE